MATYTLYEYQTMTPWGDPVEPATRTAGLSTGAAQALADGTVYFHVVPDADCYLRVSQAGTAATSADMRVVANFGTGASVPQNSGLSIYLAV